jgi:hypothetical protein
VCFLDVIMDPADNVAGSIGAACHTTEGFPDLAEAVAGSGPHGRCWLRWRSVA